MFKKKEKESVIRDRVLSLVRNVDCGILSQPMDAQVALNELSDHLLGKDWYVVESLSQEQVNTEIVYAIEMKYKRKR